jgi:2-methylfumaryl-CoA isomerase
MNRLLADLRIVEFSAFVAAPLGGMTMAQFGADVIRIDPIGGAIDFTRWPVTDSGASLYWAGLNKSTLRIRPRRAGDRSMFRISIRSSAR